MVIHWLSNSFSKQSLRSVQWYTVSSFLSCLVDTTDVCSLEFFMLVYFSTTMQNRHSCSPLTPPLCITVMGLVCRESRGLSFRPAFPSCVSECPVPYRVLHLWSNFLAPNKLNVFPCWCSLIAC